MPTAEVTLTTSLQDISALGRGRQYCWAGASSDFQATIEAADATNATTTVTIAVCAQSSGVVMLPGDASFAAKFTLVSGSLGAVWVQGPDTGSLVLDLSTSFQDVSSLSAGREVFLAGATPGLVVAIEIARSTGSTDFVEVARLTTRQMSAPLPADSSVAMRYSAVGGAVGPNTKVWICSGVGGAGAAGPAGGDLAGTYPDPTVVGLTGTAGTGIVTMIPSAQIKQIQAPTVPPSSAGKMTALRMTPATNTPEFSISLTTGPGLLVNEVDNGWEVGLNVFGADVAASGAGMGIEQFYNGNYEHYFQFHGAAFINPTRWSAYIYNILNGANNLSLSSQSISIGQYTPNGQDTVNINAIAGTHQRIATTVQIDQATLLAGTIALIDAGTALTNYAIRANGSGQIINLQANTNGSLRIDTTNLGFFAGNGAAKQTVTGSKGANAALSSLMTALGASGYNLVTDSTS